MILAVGSLFAGIGGLELGLERAGMRVAWQVEIDSYCRRVLAKHWPDVPRFEDVRTVGAHNLPPVDVICGGFPCQDISNAGKRAGIDGERSGLWSEYARIIRELRPRYVLVENVAALLGRGLGRVLGDLAESGYDAEWDCIPAAAVGAPHRRDRLFVVAYPASHDGRTGRQGRLTASGSWQPVALRSLPLADANVTRPQRRHGRVLQERPTEWAVGPGGSPVAGADAQRLQERWLHEDGEREGVPDASGCRGRCGGAAGDADVADTPRELLNGSGDAGPRWWAEPSDGGWWLAEPDVGRVANGVPARVDRLRALGNAVVPQVAQWIGEQIVAADQQASEAA